MITDVPYEIVDLRDVPVKLPPIGIFKTKEGGLALDCTGGKGWQWDDMPDEDGLLEDDEATGQVVIHTPQGRLILERLTLSNYPAVRKHYGPDLPSFTSSNELTTYFTTGIHMGTV